MNQLAWRKQAEVWCQSDPDPDTVRQVQGWLHDADEAALRKAFEAPLTFGTAGIRAPVGPGSSRMNLANVRRLVAALCAHLQDQYADAAERGLCIGFDGRRDSARFARDAADLAGSLGFRVRLFETPVPTPLLAHATQQHQARAGLMFTASHNPPTDNGIKVYWQGGAQILPPHDGILAAAMAAAKFTPTPAPGDHRPIEPMGARERSAYLDALLQALPSAPRSGPAPRIAYTAVHGVGTELTRLLLARLAITDVHEVTAECRIDPDLGGLSSPNPERPQVLKALLELARQESVDLALAHDPDADRLAVAVPDGEQWCILNGNEVGCLLGDYLLETIAERPATVVTTLVSSQLLGRVAAAHGALSRRVPTGFKWIAEEGRSLEREQGARFLFGYEEAIGYSLPALGDDKDGLAAMALLVDLWRHCRAADQSLIDRLHTIYGHHGVHRTTQLTWSWPDAPERQARVIARLAAEPPTSLASLPVEAIARDARAHQLTLWKLGESVRIALRPSGTEPKLKAYLEVHRPVRGPGGVRAGLVEAENSLKRVAEALTQYVDELQGG